MTAIDVDTIAKAEPKRDQWGRYMVHTPGGKAVGYSRATTIAGTIEDTYNLTQWKLRQAIKGVTSRKDLIVSAQAHDPNDDKKLYNDLAQSALDAAASDAAANTGTALHRLAEDLDSGRKTLDDIPEDWQPHLTAYRDTIRDAGIGYEPGHIERVVINDDYRIAGMTDRIGTIGGRRYITDIKTGKSLDFGQLKMAMQLAIYANHQATYDYAEMERGERIDVDRDTGIIIHLPATGPEAGTCHLYDIDLRHGWAAVLTAVEVRELRKDSKKWLTHHQPGVAMTTREWLAGRIQTVKEHGGPEAVRLLKTMWPEACPRPVPQNPTKVETDALDLVLGQVEARYELPFGPNRPAS